MRAELKPCPFCGGEADSANDGPFTDVFCRECGCQPTSHCVNEDEAIAAWNRRNDDDPTLLDALERMYVHARGAWDDGHLPTGAIPELVWRDAEALLKKHGRT